LKSSSTRCLRQAPTHWAVEAAVAAAPFAILAAALLLLEASDRTLAVLAAIAAAWFGIRIAIVAVKGRHPRWGQGASTEQLIYQAVALQPLPPGPAGS
jgi:hypothetical protein